MAKILLTTQTAIDTMNIYELARIDYIKKSADKRTQSKKLDALQDTLINKLNAMVSDALAGFDGDDKEKFIADFKAVNADYLRTLENGREKVDALQKKVNILTDEIKDAREKIKAFCSDYVSDTAYKNYCNKADNTDDLRDTVRLLGFGRVDTADDKPFKNFVSTVNFQRAIDKKHIETHTKCLNKYTFKELVISLIADYMLENGKDDGLYIDDENGFTQI